MSGVRVDVSELIAELSAQIESRKARVALDVIEAPLQTIAIGAIAVCRNKLVALVEAELTADSIQHLYDTAPKAVRDQVDALLGQGDRSPSHDAGSPWQQPDVVDGPLWDQDDQASLVEGMRE
jgi:hypothetical protein